MWGGAFKDVGQLGTGLQSPGAQTPRRFPACEILGVKVKYNRLHPIEQGQQNKSGAERKQVPLGNTGSSYQT